MRRPNRRFERLMVAYLEGALSERERRWVEKCLRESKACRRELEAYRRVRALSTPPPVRYPSAYAMEQFLPRLHARIEREMLFRSRRWRSWWEGGLLGLGVVEAAAALLLLIGGFGLGGRSANPPKSTNPTTLTRTTEVEPIRIIAETWVTPKLASRLAKIDVENVTVDAPPVSELALLLEETTPAASTASETSVSSSRMMGIVLPPSSLYSEEASYLLVSRR